MMAGSLLVLIVGGLILLLLLLALAGLVFWAVRRTSGSSGSSGWTGIAGSTARPQTARDVLQMRYARGEITREQYQQMLQDLEE